MPTERIPLVGVSNQRTVDGTNEIILGKDQRFLNCIFDVVKNPITGKSTFYIEKRPGWNIRSLVSAGNISTGLIKTDVLSTVVSAFGSTNSTIYDEQTSVGTITGQAIHFHETSLSGIGYVMIRSSDGTGWYYASDAKNVLSYTGTTHGNATLDNLGSTAGMYSGQLIAKADIPVGTRILSVDSGTSVTMNGNATGSTTSAVTKEPIAKILDSDFVTTGTNLSGFTDLNGYPFYCTEDGYLYNGNINTVHLYTAADKIAANISPDLPVAVARYKNSIVVFKRASTEFFQNKGNNTGSPLDSVQNLYKRVGIQHQRSMAQLEDDIYFVSSSKEGDLAVEKLSNFTITPISNPAINKIIGTSNAAGSAIYVSAFKMGGYSYVLLQILSASVIAASNVLMEDASSLLLENNDNIVLDTSESTTDGLSRELIYNVDLNIWSEWNSIPATFVKGVGSGSINQVICSSRLSTDGKIYQINPSSDIEAYADDGTAYNTVIQTSAFDLGTDNRKFIHRLRWIGDVESSGTITVEHNDNDFDSGSWVTDGTIDLTQTVKELRLLGSHKGKRAYRFTHSANAHFRAEAFDLDYTVAP